MFANRSYWTLLLTFIALSIGATWWGSYSNRANSHIAAFLASPRPQVGSPVIVDLALSEATQAPRSSKAPAGATGVVLGPVRLEAGPEGELFAIDEGAGDLIKQISPQGEILDVFFGEEAPRIQSVTDMVVLHDRLWIADLLGKSIYSVDRNTGKWQSWAQQVEPYRLEVGRSDANLLVTMRLAGPTLFDVINPAGNVHQSFGVILKDQAFYSLVLDGFTSRSGEAILYSGKHLGLLASFSEVGEVNWLVEPIQPPKPPRLMEVDDTRWVERGPLPASLSIAGNGKGFFCVLTRRISGIAVHAFLDLYRTEDGAYYKSLRLPLTERWRSVAVGEDYFYVANEFGIARWASVWLDESATETMLPNGKWIVSFSSQSVKGDLS